MRHDTIRKTTWAVTGIILLAIALCWFLLQPGGDIGNYKTYYIHEAAEPHHGAVKVTFLGAASLLIDDGETQLMIDGFISRKPLWQVATAKLSTDKAAIGAVLEKLQINRLQAVFASHSHYDHALDIAYLAQRTGAKLYGSSSTLNIGKGAGLPSGQMQLYTPGKALHIGQFSISVMQARHTPPIVYINNDLGEQITEPLRQPARFRAYKEGGTYNFLIRHDGLSLYIKPDTNFIAGQLDKIQADVLFLGASLLGKQKPEFQQAYYDETVGKLRPQLVIPIHWDNFFQPLSDHLEAMPLVADDLERSFDFLISRTKADHIQFRILQGYQSLIIRPYGQKESYELQDSIEQPGL